MLDNWLFVCGGHFVHYSDPTADCKKVDLNSASPAWQQFTNLPSKRRAFQLLRYDNYMYAIGGYTYGSGGTFCRNE